MQSKDLIKFSITPETIPFHPACATPTIDPSFLLMKTGKQSAVRIPQTTPNFEVKLASALATISSHDKAFTQTLECV